MVTRVEVDPLRIEFTFPDGTAWTGRIGKTANPVLAEGLARGLVELVHPLGDTKRQRTAEQFTSALRRMADELATAGFHGGVSDLRKSHMLPYWMSSTAVRVEQTRMLLRGCGERVNADLRAYIEGRPAKQRQKSKPLRPYSEDQWRVIESGLRERITHLLTAQREVLALSERGPDASDRGMNRQNYAWLLSEQGPLRLTAAAKALGLTVDYFRDGRSLPLLEAREALFPSVRAVTAARLLFGVYSGVVPDGIRDLGLDDFTWTGDRSVLMDYVKRRRGPESVTLPSRAIRLFERWQELSAPLRRFAPEPIADDLWLFLDSQSRIGTTRDRLPVMSSAALRKSGNKARRFLSEELDMRTDTGGLVLLHAGRVRTTYHNMLARRGWTGRTTIDPNHTAEVEGSHYVSTTTPAQTDAVATIIEDAQADILRRARPAVVLTEEEAARFAANHPHEVAQLGVDHDGVAQLLSSETDVFTAACANQFAGIHGPAGKPCPARPWVCLLCPLAVFLPRHAPNLLRLKAYFARQSQRMTVDQFLAVFGPYADRLNHEVLPRFEAGVLTEAAAEVNDTDSELPLRPEETTR